jgi:type I restriction enzyme S subunit
MAAITLNNIDKSNWKPFPFEKIAKRISESVDPNKTELEVYIGLEHLDAETVHIRRHGSPADVSGGKLKCYPGDVIFGKRRAYQRKAGIVTQEGICSAHSFVFRANEEVIDAKLFPYFLHSDQFMHRMVDISVGGLSPTINWSDLKHQEFLLPPKEQQAELAELLWAMDTVIEKDLEVLERLEKYKIVKSKVLFSQFDKTVKLSDVATIIMGQSPDGKTYNEQGDGIPFIQGNAEFSSVGPINKLFTTAPTKLCKEGDILISVRAPVGDLNIAQKEFCIGRGLAAIRLNDESLKHYVYEFLLNSKHILDSKSSGSTFKSINKDVLSDLDIQITDSKSVLNNLLIFYESANLSLKQLKSKLQSSKALQKALINQVF